eukprot:jgi/Bigna1/146523/aug1.116_g21231
MYVQLETSQPFRSTSCHWIRKYQTAFIGALMLLCVFVPMIFLTVVSASNKGNLSFSVAPTSRSSAKIGISTPAKTTASTSLFGSAALRRKPVGGRKAHRLLHSVFHRPDVSLPIVCPRAAAEQLFHEEGMDLRQLVDNGCQPTDLQQRLEQGYYILDVRPRVEAEAIHPRGSLLVPFTPVREQGRVKSIYAPNTDFFSQLKRKNILKDSKLVVACGDGPRSLIACKQMQEAGYKNAEWLVGGLGIIPEGVLESEGDQISVGYAKNLGKSAQFVNEVMHGVVDASQKLANTLENVDVDAMHATSIKISERALEELHKIDMDDVEKKVHHACWALHNSSSPI